MDNLHVVSLSLLAKAKDSRLNRRLSEPVTIGQIFTQQVGCECPCVARKVEIELV